MCASSASRSSSPTFPSATASRLLGFSAAGRAGSAAPWSTRGPSESARSGARPRSISSTARWSPSSWPAPEVTGTPPSAIPRPSVGIWSWAWSRRRAHATTMASTNNGPVRIVIAKPGLDGHDRGAKVIAKALKDAGMEVIYTGRHQTVDAIVAAVLQEDAEACGLSILSGAHMDYCARLVERLRQEGADDVLMLVGGT